NIPLKVLALSRVNDCCTGVLSHRDKLREPGRLLNHVVAVMKHHRLYTQNQRSPRTTEVKMPEKRDIEIKSRADTIGLMDLDVRPYPVTPPPSYEEVKPVYERRKALEFCNWAEENLRFEKRYEKDEALR